MAISKKRKRLGHTEAPDAFAFVQLLEAGLAEPHVVSAAYQHAMDEWKSSQPGVDLMNVTYADGGVVRERVEPDEEPTPEGVLVALQRTFMFCQPDQEES